MLIWHSADKIKWLAFCLVLVLVWQMVSSGPGDQLHIGCCVHLKEEETINCVLLTMPLLPHCLGSHCCICNNTATTNNNYSKITHLFSFEYLFFSSDLIKTQHVENHFEVVTIPSATNRTCRCGENNQTQKLHRIRKYFLPSICYIDGA